MSSTLKLVLTLFVAFLMGSVVMARPYGATSTLAARLKLDQQGSSCWGSLFQLQACSSELILFFMNGETNVGAGCCNTIQTIQRDCWPTLLSSIGFTAKEGNILRGFCDHVSTMPKPLLP